MKTAVILGTVRQGRHTEKLAKWVVNETNKRGGIEVELLDLADYPLPFFEEPVSPKFNPDRHPAPEAKKWLDKLASFDSYIIVTPEYNHSVPGVLKNALDYSDFQVARKPISIVSHGSAGGARAAAHLKNIISEIRAVPMSANMALTMRVSEVFDEHGTLAEEIDSKEHGPKDILANVLDDLAWYSDALATARSKS
ncbi:MAG TPA: NAD(P)H-dependent oxidoreductase [Candidatus Saccharimonadales bacterium]|nr:NAD(P)H-dependent oxidoreductase [Candidatus Saccharimonadales bacterium]